jgi:anaerobic magnesium-protoporphyrin IX monomethyl ester cyclase
VTPGRAHRPQVLEARTFGSTSAHPIAMDLTRRSRLLLPNVVIVYGGVFPT